LIFSTGPSPDPKLIEDRPDDVSLEAAVGAWQAGYLDARNKRAYHIFPADSEDLQPFYSNGFERGERDELHMQRINERIPEEERSKTPSGARPAPVVVRPPFLRRAALRARATHKALKTNSDLLMVGSVLAVAAAMVWG
jgi:hypothetical protein